MNGMMKSNLDYRIEFEQEEDGRWIADIRELPGMMAYSSSKREAESKVQAIKRGSSSKLCYAIHV